MNKVILMGRLTRDPEVRYSAGENALAIARYTLAVDRRFRRDGEQVLILSAVFLRTYSRICGKVFQTGTENCSYGTYPDRKLYEP